MLLKDMLALILAGVTGTIALAILFKAIIEYKRPTKRLELFLAMRTRSDPL